MKKVIFALASMVFLISAVYGTDMVEEYDMPIEVATEQISNFSKGAGQVQSKGLNLRSNPNEDATILVVLDKESYVIIYDKVGDWYCVGINGEKGYVYCDHLDYENEIEADFGYGKVSKDAVKVRPNSNLGGAPLFLLAKDDIVHIIGVDGEWYKVEKDDIEGYVRSDLIELIDFKPSKILGENNSQEEEKNIAQNEVKTVIQFKEEPIKEEKIEEEIEVVEEKNEVAAPQEVPQSEESKVLSSIIETAIEYLGVPYVWGGTSPSGFDCSGFTQYVFSRCGYSLSRIASAQYSDGTPVDYSELTSGDLIFFINTYATNGISHVGIYIGDGEFIHCANGGVKISSLDESYYSSRYYGACRIG